MRIPRFGRLVLAASFVAIGLWGLIAGAAAGIWAPLPRTWPAHAAIGRACALFVLVCGAGLLWRRTGMAAAGLLLAGSAAWMLAVKVPPILKAPLSAVAWESWGETAVLTAAAWTLFAEAAGGGAGLRRLAGERGVRIARALYGLALLAFGWSHFAYAGPTAQLVPRALPAHLAWVYLTGATYLAAGAALLTGFRARLAAELSVLQMGLFTALVWLPAVAGGDTGNDYRSELILSLALTAAGWVVADGALSRARRRS